MVCSALSSIEVPQRLARLERRGRPNFAANTPRLSLADMLRRCMLLRFFNLLQADILMVTDGEIAPPKQELLDDIARAHEEMGLEVHGLLVSSQVSESMQKLCTHLHVFKSWSKVGAESWQY
jgi:uncharacterized protein with von Willebrand factor type A (vWA) domain